MTLEPKNRADFSSLPGTTLVPHLPFMLKSVLERHYLNQFDPYTWNLQSRPNDFALPLLQQVTAVAPSTHAQQHVQVMTSVLNACFDPGHAVYTVIHGTGTEHRLYVGARRIQGVAAGSTEGYLLQQQGAFHSAFTGLQLQPHRRLHAQEMPELVHFIQTAPDIAAMTGIPSVRALPANAIGQNLSNLVKAIGTHRYVLMVVSEPLDSLQIDQTLDTCRQLQSEIHSYIKTTVSQSQGSSEGYSERTHEKSDQPLLMMPTYLSALSYFLRSIPPFKQKELSTMLRMVRSMVGVSNILVSADPLFQDTITSRQIQRSSSEQQSRTIEIFNVDAKACDILLEGYIQRLILGRSQGWWQTAIYIVAQDEATRQMVAGAVRSIASGENTALDPFRTFALPIYQARDAVARGQILSLTPQVANYRGHPLGRAFDSLGTCLSSEELGVLMSFPQEEWAGILMRVRTSFALTVPPPPPATPAITLGMIVDSVGRTITPLQITAEELNHHAFVVGTTGAGKSTTCQRILTESYTQLGIPFLVLEPVKGEYQHLRHHPDLKGKLQIYTIGKPGDALPLRLNPFTLLPGVVLEKHIGLLQAVFTAAFDMSWGMPEILEDALRQVYTERGWNLYTSKNQFLEGTIPPSLDHLSALTPSLTDLLKQVEFVLKRKNYAAEVNQNMGAALRNRIESLMLGNKGLTLNSRRSTPLEQIFTRPTVIDLSNIGNANEKAFVLAVLFIFLYEYAELRQHHWHKNQRTQLQHLTLIEEAHQLLRATGELHSGGTRHPIAQSVELFTNMLAEMRAFGEGFLIAEQIPTKITSDVLKNTGLKIIHRLTNAQERHVVGSGLNLSTAQTDHLINLKKGEAVIHNEYIGAAVMAKITPATLLDTADQTVGVLEKANEIYLFRHGGCDQCPNPCTFYHAIDSKTQVLAFEPMWEALFAPVLQLEAWWTQWQEAYQQWKKTRYWRNQIAESERLGITFCALTNHAYIWLESFLARRYFDVQSITKASPTSILPPEAWLLRETLAHILSKICRLLAEFPDNHEIVLTKIAEDKIATQLHDALTMPPVEYSGCANCPARCQFLHIVSPFRAKWIETLKPRNATLIHNETFLTSLQSQVKNHKIAVLHNETDQNKALYCLVTLAESSDIPGVPELLAKIHSLI